MKCPITISKGYRILGEKSNTFFTLAVITIIGMIGHNNCIEINNASLIIQSSQCISNNSKYSLYFIFPYNFIIRYWLSLHHHLLQLGIYNLHQLAVVLVCSCHAWCSREISPVGSPGFVIIEVL